MFSIFYNLHIYLHLSCTIYCMIGGLCRRLLVVHWSGERVGSAQTSGASRLLSVARGKKQERRPKRL